MCNRWDGLDPAGPIDAVVPGNFGDKWSERVLGQHRVPYAFQGMAGLQRKTTTGPKGRRSRDQNAALKGVQLKAPLFHQNSSTEFLLQNSFLMF